MKNIFDEINTREKLKTQLIMEDTYWKLKKLDVDLFNKFKVLYKEYMNIEENYSPFFNRISEILHDM